MVIFYSHHMYKYGTPIEESEIRTIKKVFPDAQIINPSKDIPQNLEEQEIMKMCLESVEKSDAFVFSTMNGVVGKGCATEIFAAQKAKKPMYLINRGTLEPVNFVEFSRLSELNDDREYASIETGWRLFVPDIKSGDLWSQGEI